MTYQTIQYLVHILTQLTDQFWKPNRSSKDTKGPSRTILCLLHVMGATLYENHPRISPQCDGAPRTNKKTPFKKDAETTASQNDVHV